MATKTTDKYWVTNLTDWNQSFAKITTNGELMIPPKGKIRIQDEEIKAQIYAGNVLFVGENRDGSHARLYVEDKAFRVEMELEVDTTTQTVCTDKVFEGLFKIEDNKKFEEEVKSKIKTFAEKHSIMEYAKKKKINDYEKVQFLEAYTEYKFK